MNDRLILRDQLLELGNFLRKGEGFSGEGAMFRLRARFAQGGGEGLVNLVIGEPLRLPCVDRALRL